MAWPRVVTGGGGSSTPGAGSVTDATVASNAAIAASKIAGTAVTQADTGTVTSGLIAANAVTTGKLASGIPQSLTASGSSTAAVADTSAHVVGGAPIWNGTGWIGLGPKNYFINGSNANIAETVPRNGGGAFSATTAIGTAGLMTSWAIELYAGMTITNLTFRVGTTAATWGTNNDGHWWVALYDTQATPALIAQSADGGHVGLTASANNTVALGSPAPYSVTTSGVYYVSLMVNTGTGGTPVQPTLSGVPVGSANTSAIVSGQKVIAQTSGSALGATAPGTITSGSAIGGLAYVATS